MSNSVFPQVVLVQKIGSISRLFTSNDLQVPEGHLLSDFWFVCKRQGRPIILRVVGYTDTLAKGQGVPLYPLKQHQFNSKQLSAWTVQVEEVVVPSARGMTTEQISEHFNWSLVVRF